MNILQVDPEAPEAAALERAAGVLRGGGLVAFPTETVYGLGAAALDPAAVARIYAAKGRPSYNPLIVHVADVAAARELAGRWPEAAERLARAFWPGPLTLVVPRSRDVPDAVTAGLPNVALRIPAHPVARALLQAARIPVAAPSANRSTEISPTTAEHVARSLGGRVDLILDGGPCPVGIESTVVSVAAEVPTILRPGTITAEQVREAAGAVAFPSDTPEAEAARPSPGMLDRHYAPRARLVLVDCEDVPREAGGERAAVIAIRAECALPPGDVVRMPSSPREYAARLYATLHDLDVRGYDAIYVEAPPDAPEWLGVRDRLRRAATPG